MTPIISVEKEWNDFHQAVLPDVDPGSIQYRESKKVFISAIAQTLLCVRDVLGNSNLSEMEAALAIENMYNECMEFFRDTLSEQTQRHNIQ